MGRKPNPFILQHFERGAKLNDSSNRYQHTCKSCGEKFPKGRIESLNAHIVRKCAGLTTQQRHQALLEINNFANPPSVNNNHRDVQMHGATAALPMDHNWTTPMTALETLAEVSRQQLDKHDDPSVHNRSVGEDIASEPPRAEKLELQEQYTLDNPPRSYEQRAHKEKKHIYLKKNFRRESEASLPPANFAAQLGLSRSVSPSLVMAATSMAAAAEARFVPSMVDPQLLGEDLSRQNVREKTIEQALAEASASFSDHMFGPPAEQQMVWPMLNGTDGNGYAGAEVPDHPMEDPQITRAHPRALAMSQSMTTEFSAEYGNGEKGNKPKVRGRFTADRRKEVQVVRKMGACMRCRMLKKPCSDESPCGTCKSVESARLWKVPCIRNRLGEDFAMYSAGLHTVLAHREETRTQATIHRTDVSHVIECSHFPQTTVYATFNAREGRPITSVGNIDPGLDANFNINSVKWLDHERDDLPVKLEAYMKRMSNVFFENESSDFMRITLTIAQALAVEKDDALLSLVLELWSVVHILVDHELSWTISERVNPDAPAGQGPIIDRNANRSTYDLLCLQLNAAAEKKAALICKKVMSDLEKRLMQRVPNAFETFLVGIILLNCVERSTWLFKSWEQESFNSRWPLNERQPSSFCAQGDKMTDMLDMLLRVRHVPPKTYTKPDGIIATDVNDGQREYFEHLQLNFKDVYNKQLNPVFNPAESRCYELRFCSKLLLPIPTS